ncbi:MAG: metal ABC transporter substrate-binding protein [Acidobacteriota bacterium]|nr:metal ABC transporter substrate-binding protein [Acidobacteriota bacterium]
MRNFLRSRFLLPALLALMSPAAGSATLQVVTTLPAYAAIAQYLGGDLVEARAISRGDEDAHFVKPKPSFALMLKTADLFVTTGLDLELWAPTLVDKSGNRNIRDGQPGFVSASEGIAMSDIPASVSREAGDVHIYGNPHIDTSPINAKRIAANIAAGLARVDRENASLYQKNLAAFEAEIDRSLYGDELVELLGSETLDPLARQGKLFSFLESQHYEGKPLTERLGGWLARTAFFREREIIAYHKNWIYFTDLIGLEIADYVERKPGIPPSARHVLKLLEIIDERRIQVLLAASYFNQRQIQTIAERSGCRAAVVDLGPMQINERAYFELVDGWLGALETAFGGG